MPNILTELYYSGFREITDIIIIIVIVIIIIDLFNVIVICSNARAAC